jgi:osmoprotectant transport system permease protein
LGPPPGLGLAPWGNANPVLLVLVAAMAVSALGLGFVSVAPNRIVSGMSLPVWQAVSGPYLAVLALGLSGLAVLVVAPATARMALAETLLALVLLVTLVLAAGFAATQAVAAGGPAVRVSLGAAFWIAALASALAATDGLSRLRVGAPAKALWGLVVAAALGLVAGSGWLSDLSLAREFANRSDLFAAALTRHVVLVVGALLPACLIGAPLGLLALRRQSWSAPLFTALNLVQTIPSIALFGLLIEPLTRLTATFPALRGIGISGIGMAPALIALTLYALLPVARSVNAAFAGVPAAARDAARGMGMSPSQVLWQVSLPLAVPVLLSGLRIVTIQLIGLAVVAALIGAGGLGTFVFQGLGQTATDLVLLGALSAIALALLTDALLRAAASPLDKGSPDQQTSPGRAVS